MAEKETQWILQTQHSKYRGLLKEPSSLSLTTQPNPPTTPTSASIEPLVDTDEDVDGPEDGDESEEYFGPDEEYISPDEEYFRPDEDDYVNNTEYDSDDDTPGATRCRESFANFLRNWATDFNVPQNALKPLIREINVEFGADLPKDPRSLMRKYT